MLRCVKWVNDVVDGPFLQQQQQQLKVVLKRTATATTSKIFQKSFILINFKFYSNFLSKYTNAYFLCTILFYLHIFGKNMKKA